MPPKITIQKDLPVNRRLEIMEDVLNKLRLAAGANTASMIVPPTQMSEVRPRLVAGEQIGFIFSTECMIVYMTYSFKTPETAVHVEVTYKTQDEQTTRQIIIPKENYVGTVAIKRTASVGDRLYIACGADLEDVCLGVLTVPGVSKDSVVKILLEDLFKKADALDALELTE